MPQILLGILSLLILAGTIVLIISLILKIKNEKSHEFTSYYQTVNWMRILSSFIDWAILAIIMFLIPKIISLIIPVNDNYLDLMRILSTYSIATFLIVKYGGTPGKLLLNIKIININGMNLSVKKALLRQIFNISLELISLYLILILAYATKSDLPINILLVKNAIDARTFPMSRTHPSGDNSHAVVGGHLLITTVYDRLKKAGLVHSGFGIVGDEYFGDAFDVA